MNMPEENAAPDEGPRIDDLEEAEDALLDRIWEHERTAGEGAGPARLPEGDVL
jgi:hypothetical protein